MIGRRRKEQRWLGRGVRDHLQGGGGQAGRDQALPSGHVAARAAREPSRTARHARAGI